MFRDFACASVGARVSPHLHILILLSLVENAAATSATRKLKIVNNLCRIFAIINARSLSCSPSQSSEREDGSYYDDRSGEQRLCDHMFTPYSGAQVTSSSGPAWQSSPPFERLIMGSQFRLLNVLSKNWMSPPASKGPVQYGSGPTKRPLESNT